MELTKILAYGQRMRILQLLVEVVGKAIASPDSVWNVFEWYVIVWVEDMDKGEELLHPFGMRPGLIAVSLDDGEPVLRDGFYEFYP